MKRRIPRSARSRVAMLVVSVIAVFAFGISSADTRAVSPLFVAVDLGALGDGGSYAYAINEAGQVVGGTNVAPAQSHPFLWTEDDGMIDLGSLGGPNASALEVNDAGLVVGTANLPPQGWQSHAFAWTPTGGLVDLGTLDGSPGSSHPYDLGNTGQIVGMSYTSWPQHAFSWTQAGGMVDTGTLGGTGTNTFALAVNDSGQVVGQSPTLSGARHAFSWTEAGGIVDLGTLGGSTSYAAGVSNAGLIVGNSTTADGQTHAFLRAASGPMVDLGTLGGTTSRAVAVNDAGQVAGNSTNAAGQSHAFLWAEGIGMIDLGTLGGPTSSVGAPSMGSSNALSNAGQVVGSSEMASGPPHAFSWTAATGMVDLGTLSGEGTSEAKAVNESGQIVGWSTTAAGGTHATLWQSPDTTPPLIAPTVTGTLGGNGWYTSDVTISWAVVDDESAISSRTGCDSTTISADTAGTTLTCSATSGGGTSSESVTIMRDATPPSLSPSVSPGLVLLHGPVSVTPGAADAVAGLASQDCGPVDTSAAGDHTVTCAATDNAGNADSVTVHYTVQYRILGFFWPAHGPKWRADDDVKIVVALGDAAGMRIPDAEAAAQLSPTCRVKFSAAGAQTRAAVCLKYEKPRNQFSFNWELGKGTGAATIRVDVSYPGTTTVTTLSEGITITKR